MTEPKIHAGLSEGRLISRRDWAPGLATLIVEAEIEPFVPGQFVNLALERDGQLERRSAGTPWGGEEFAVDR